jgi:hypothetical protein
VPHRAKIGEAITAAPTRTTVTNVDPKSEE